MANYELRIETADFKKSLDILGTVINKKNALPILADVCVRYDRERKLFTMTAGNTEQYIEIECWRNDEQADKGVRPWLFLDKDDRQAPFEAVCFNVEAFREAFGQLPSMPSACFLTLNDGGGSLTVTHNKGRFTLPVESALDYPPVPKVVEKGGEMREGVNPVVKFSMETQCLLPIVGAARVCVANDELRPVMNAVCLDAFHDHLIIVASDGHSLYRQNLDTGMGWLRYGEFGATESAKVLLPSQSLSPLMKALGASQSFTLTADTQRIRIENASGSVRLTSVCIEGRYPNYESVIPKDNQHRLVLDRAELSATLRRISLFSNESSNMCILNRRDEHVSLNASDADFGRQADEQVAIINPDSTLADGTQIGFKISTMQKLLGCIGSDNVVLEIGTPDRAMLLKEDERVSSKTLLIMPMLVNS